MPEAADSPGASAAAKSAMSRRPRATIASSRPSPRSGSASAMPPAPGAASPRAASRASGISRPSCASGSAPGAATRPGRTSGRYPDHKQLGHALERRSPSAARSTAEAAAVHRPAGRQRGDRRVEHRLAPAQRARRHRRRGPPARRGRRLQPLEVLVRSTSGVDPLLARHAADLAAADVRVERADLRSRGASPRCARRPNVDRRFYVDQPCQPTLPSERVGGFTMTNVNPGLEGVIVADTADLGRRWRARPPGDRRRRHRSRSRPAPPRSRRRTALRARRRRRSGNW